MAKPARFGFILAALLLIPVFYQPVWTITFSSPTLEKDFGAYFWIDDITSHSEGDLETINFISKHIGLEELDPYNTPYFEYTQAVVIGIMVFSVLVALFGSRGLAWLWVFLVVAAVLAGLAELFMIGFDYGHNMDPRQSIVIPDSPDSEQPTDMQTLQNVNVASWPYWGAFWIGISWVTGMLSIWLNR